MTSHNPKTLKEAFAAQRGRQSADRRAAPHCPAPDIEPQTVADEAALVGMILGALSGGIVGLTLGLIVASGG
ncbi:hypothetical protein EV659_1203 [Rhodothalassium salexigens DSM 2132]|uniref:Uncharacterized protein n=1 Tax=Rhodothalassium salexigens DSM 2132 TaxID=1188247 RepID=A0A4R2P5L8_RHOSA|nr:hypothetical protein [Rhodothalassium salexigens]MBB4212829.1 uncharacterized protein YcfJ [Rhodothalassium salexigens DSM 2132]MBK1640229.1 hypothetical protein [Rhodothalassium salexigens DSM 2132]TCP29498.1 hypothetical protein EV659_1203 [Rhodothalassium salexigens DSM 2132]